MTAIAVHCSKANVSLWLSSQNVFISSRPYRLIMQQVKTVELSLLYIAEFEHWIVL